MILKRRRRGGDGDGERPADLRLGRPWVGSDFLARLALRLFVWDDHGLSPIRGWGQSRTTRRREPRGVSGTLEVSPTGSIPRRENPAWQVANDKVEASRAKLRFGQEAPKGIRPLTRVTRPRCRDKHRSRTRSPKPKFTGREGAAEGGTIGFAGASGLWRGEPVLTSLKRERRPCEPRRVPPMESRRHQVPRAAGGPAGAPVFGFNGRAPPSGSAFRFSGGGVTEGTVTAWPDETGTSWALGSAWASRRPRGPSG